MSTISRDTFINQMSARPLDAQELPPQIAAKVTPAELKKIGGEDQVVNTKEEYGKLYDRLVELEKAPAAKGGNVDYAQAMADARAKSGAAQGPPPVDDLLRMRTDRPRTTGILSPSPISDPVAAMALVPQSSVARTIGQIAMKELEPAANKDVLGPAGTTSRRIESMTNKTVGEIEALEKQAKSFPKGSPERAKIEDQIQAKVDDLQRRVDSEMGQYKLGQPKKDVPMLDKLKGSLPPYVKDSIDREGVVIPGVPGAIKPNFTNPGASWGLKF
jgi:hypothetical protein